MVDFITAFATAGQAIKLVQDLRGIDKAVDAVEYENKIADLTGALADLKFALIEAKDDLAIKDAEIDRLKKQLPRRAEFVEHNGYSYDKGKDGQPKGTREHLCEPQGEQILGYAPIRAALQHKRAGAEQTTTKGEETLLGCSVIC
jgi:hypothetical protein